MTVRPPLKAGDVVKLSKKGRAHERAFPKNSTMVVSRVDTGDGVERSSIITCRIVVEGEYQYHQFFRSELWSIGKNVFNRPNLI